MLAQMNFINSLLLVELDNLGMYVLILQVH